MAPHVTSIPFAHLQVAPKRLEDAVFQIRGSIKHRPEHILQLLRRGGCPFTRTRTRTHTHHILIVYRCTYKLPWGGVRGGRPRSFTHARHAFVALESRLHPRREKKTKKNVSFKSFATWGEIKKEEGEVKAAYGKCGGREWTPGERHYQLWFDGDQNVYPLKRSSGPNIRSPCLFIALRSLPEERSELIRVNLPRQRLVRLRRLRVRVRADATQNTTDTQPRRVSNQSLAPPSRTFRFYLAKMMK